MHSLNPTLNSLVMSEGLLPVAIPDESWLFCFGYINQREHPTISKDRTHMILNS